ncbi:hypothetical protein BDN72DRAFT_840017 [Pluteus cervinus]|uniref:Uncharacterized protein n=1 Tax=Pluteus cervinus TaxID=181527 RepID=A0ACD3AW22_9AGAR|nr:hypothetical protein BDN72DRAFT_840017 [Pluteus cervinus]
MSMTSPTTQIRFSDPHDDARKKIDEEITQLKTQIVSLKLSRNALAPINRLHPEVLQEIFITVHNSSEHKGKTTLLITWISHNWRDLAHCVSALWGHIDFRHPAWVDASLARAKNSGLDVSLNSALRKPKYDLKPLFPLCIGNLSRIEKLKVTSPVWFRHSMRFESSAPEWLIPAPILVHLYFHGLSLPPGLFSGIFPSLESLHISDCHITWDALPVRSGLKELIVKEIHPRTTVDDVVKTLEDIGPGLEVLGLQDVFVPATTSDSLSVTRVQLEKLKKVGLQENEAFLITPLLNRLSFPGCINVEITTKQWPDSDFVQSLVSARNIESWPIDHLHIKIRQNSTKFCIVEDWSKQEGFTNKRADNRTHIQFEALTHEVPSELMPVLDFLPIRSVRFVFFSGGLFRLQALTFLNFLGTLGTIDFLSFEAPYFATFMSWIQERDEMLSAIVDKDGELDEVIDKEMIVTAQKTVVFHNLQTLEVCGDPLTQTRDQFTCDDALAVKKWLTWRKRLHLQVAKLEINEMSTPSISWLIGLYDGLVGAFGRRDVTERNGAECKED